MNVNICSHLAGGLGRARHLATEDIGPSLQMEESRNAPAINEGKAIAAKILITHGIMHKNASTDHPSKG